MGKFYVMWLDSIWKAFYPKAERACLQVLCMANNSVWERCYVSERG